MLGWKIVMLFWALAWGSSLSGQQYGESHYRQVSPNGRYEPRRPGEPSSSIVSPATRQRTPTGRFAPTRPGETRTTQTGFRSAPRRPNEPRYPIGEQNGNRRNRILKTAYHVYEREALSGFDAKQLAVLQQQLSAAEAAERTKGKVLGKVVTYPVKLVYKVAKKVIGKVAFDWWIPLL